MRAVNMRRRPAHRLSRQGDSRLVLAVSLIQPICSPKTSPKLQRSHRDGSREGRPPINPNLIRRLALLFVSHLALLLRFLPQSTGLPQSSASCDPPSSTSCAWNNFALCLPHGPLIWPAWSQSCSILAQSRRRSTALTREMPRLDCGIGRRVSPQPTPPQVSKT